MELVSLEPDHPRAHGNLDYYKRELENHGASLIQRGEDGLGDPDEAVNVMKVFMFVFYLGGFYLNLNKLNSLPKPCGRP